ncbi:MAG: cyclic nucleotide-binding domain-containing protein [Limisphaerales bacterium]
MAVTPASLIKRPGRRDWPFSDEMEQHADRLLEMEPFVSMDRQRLPKLREILLHDTRLRIFRKGEIVVRQGDYGTSAFMILSGGARVVLNELPRELVGRREQGRKPLWRLLAQLWSSRRAPESFNASELKMDARARASTESGGEVRVFLQDIPRVLDQHKTAVMEPGEFFGEIAALSRMPRTATIFANEEPTEMLEIRWQGLRDLLRYDARLKEHIDRIYRERALASHLRAIPWLQHLDAAAWEKVLDQTEFGTYGDYDWSGEYKKLVKEGKATRPAEPVIAKEGDYPNGVIFVRAGFARIAQAYGRGERTLSYLGAGQHYGLDEIIHNSRNPDQPVALQRTVRAIGYTHVLIVPTAIVEQYVLPGMPAKYLPTEIQPPTPAKTKNRRPAPTAHQISSDMMEFLSENRYFNGRATMLIDLDRCTRCDDCVRACATAHDNNPRFLRSGPVHSNVMVANACMHCADPVCMIGCPTGAIHRTEAGGEVVINPITCIGCKACFSNCPYDAIRMVEIRDEQGSIVVGTDMKPVLKATKCDLCVEQIGGPACERACPHGALTRMNMGDLDEFTGWIDR